MALQNKNDVVWQQMLRRLRATRPGQSELFGITCVKLRSITATDTFESGSTPSYIKSVPPVGLPGVA
jgi:hypothetical protein